MRLDIRALVALFGVAFLGFLVLTSGGGTQQATAAALPAMPSRWPTTMQIGMADAPGGAENMKATAPFGFRYQYLAGGVNTGGGWSTWNPDGAFATYYIQDSVANNITPVFTYYMLFQSNPGVSKGEANGVMLNLQNTQTMTAYYNDLKLFFQRAGAVQDPVVLHVEPDLWGFMQSNSGDNATALSAKVSSTGLPELAGLPENARGFAQAIVRLRDRYAPNVLVAYHLSTWGTGQDPVSSNPSNAQIDQLASRSANYYLSLQANFDLVFAEFTDRDAGFKQYIYGDNGASWWDDGDFTRNVRYLQGFVTTAQKRVVMWQIPLGNKKMRAMNNTWNHYQDNKVEWLLDEPARTHLQAYAQAGVVAFLFGRGADGATCACDAAGDGVTNPSAINGNTLTSIKADDDGGFFGQKAAAYYTTGAVGLPNDTSQPTATSTPQASSSATPTATDTPIPAKATPVLLTATPLPATATPVAPTAQASWTTSATVSRARLTGGVTQNATASIRVNRKVSALVDIEIYDPDGQRAAQKFYDNEAFIPNTPRSFALSWTAPSNAVRGTYTVRIGVFAPGWSQLYSWNNSAVTFLVN